MAQAARESGVATRPIEDMEAYKGKPVALCLPTGMLMRPGDHGRKGPPDAQKKRVAYADGEDERVCLRAAQWPSTTRLPTPSSSAARRHCRPH